MKQLFYVLFFLSCFQGTVTANEISYSGGSWENIKAKAKAENKYIFVDCYTDWCSWCKVMDKETMTDAGIISFLNEKFVSAKIDMEHGEGIKIAMKYHIRSYPSFMFFNPRGELVYVSLGYQGPKDFMTELTNALDKGKQFTAPGYSANIDIDFPEFYKKTFEEKGKRKMPKDEEVNTFLSTQKDMFSEVSWALISRFNVNEKYSAFFLNNIQKYETLYGESNVAAKVNSYLYSKERAAVESKDNAAFEKILGMADKYVKHDAAGTKLNLRMDYYKETGDWTRFMKAFDDYMGVHGYDNVDYINSLCWNMYENCTDKTALNKACVYMCKAVAKEPRYVYMDTYAALLYKAGKTGEAETWADKAIAEGKAKGENTASTEELLKKIKSPEKATSGK